MLNWCDAPRCWARPQVTGAEVLNFGSELALFPLSLCSSSQLLHPAVLEQEGLLWVVSKVWGWAVAIFLLSEIQTASGVLPGQLQIMAALWLLRHHLGFELLQISQSSFLAGCTSPCSSVELWCQASGVGMFTPYRLGGKPGRVQETSQSWVQVPLVPSALLQFSSVAQACLTLCDPMNHRTPGLPVHHQLPQSTKTHVHWVGDAIQPSHPLSSPAPPALNLSQHQGLFKWVSSLHQVAKVLEFQLQHQSFQWTPRTEFC